MSTWGSAGEGFLPRGSQAPASRSTQTSLGPALISLNHGTLAPAMVVGSMRTPSQPVNAFQAYSPALATNSRTASIQKHQARRGRHAFPQSTASRSQGQISFDVTVVFIPWPALEHELSYLLNDQVTPPEIRLQQDELSDFLTILGDHHLVFPLSFPAAVNPTPTTPLWEAADIQIQAWFTLHQLEFENKKVLGKYAPLQNSQSKRFHQLDWKVMQTRKLSARDGRKKIDINSLMSGNGFTQQGLTPKNTSSTMPFPNPLSGLGQQPLLFLCPRYTEVVGILETFPGLRPLLAPGVHRCFTLRVLQELTSEALSMRCFHGHTIDCVVACHPGPEFCPQNILQTNADPGDPETSVDLDPGSFNGCDFEHGLSLNNTSELWQHPIQSQANRVHLRSPESQRDLNPAESSRRRLLNDISPSPSARFQSTMTASSSQSHRWEIHSDVGPGVSSGSSSSSSSTSMVPGAASPFPCITNSSLVTASPPWPPGLPQNDQPDHMLPTAVSQDFAPLHVPPLAPPNSPHLPLPTRVRFTLSPSPSPVTINTVLRWQRALAAAALSGIRRSQCVEISGEDVAAVADCLQKYIHWVTEREELEISISTPTLSPWVLPDRIRTCRRVSFNSFLQVYREYTVGSHGSGPGVERSVFTQMLSRMAMSAEYWQQIGTFYAPVFSTGGTSASRRTWWRSYGRLMGLYVFYYGLGPLPVSPFLLLALLSSEGGSETFDSLSHAWVAALDPDTATKIQPWLNLDPKEPLPEPLSDEVRSCLIDYTDINPLILRSIVDSESAHKRQTQEIISRVALGITDPWSNPEFKALRKGFSFILRPALLPISDSDEEEEIPYTPEVTITTITCETFGKPGLPSLVLRMYSQGVQHPRDIWNLCSFETCPPLTSNSSPFEKTHAERSELFQRRFRRYLYGSGPPLHPTLVESGLLNSADADTQANDPALRARLFLKAITDSAQVPIDRNYRIEFSWPTQHSRHQIDVRAESQNGQASHQETSLILIHTCSHSLDVFLTDVLQNLMDEESVDNSHPTAFDGWFHAQLLSVSSFYNDI